jgi:hypothetical protein
VTVRTLHAVELRDEAVRVLRRAVEHVQALEYRDALKVVETDGVYWWDLAKHEPAVEAFDARAAS